MQDVDFNVDIDYDIIGTIIKAPEKTIMSDVRGAFPKMWASMWMMFNQENVNAFHTVYKAIATEHMRASVHMYPEKLGVVVIINDFDDPDNDEIIFINDRKLGDGVQLLVATCSILMWRKPEGWTKNPVDTDGDSVSNEGMNTDRSDEDETKTVR